MNYEKDQSAESEISYVSEPAVAYAARGKAAKEPWEATDEGDREDDGPDTEARLENALRAPEFHEFLRRSHEQAMAELEAGLCRSHEEVWADLERDIRNGTL